MAKQNTSINAALIEFGLTEIEARVYQAGLALGSRPASVIAQKSGLKRGHAYNVLNALMQKGIVQEFVKGGVKNFTFSPPSSLLAMLNMREEELRSTKERLESIMPELENIRSQLTTQPKVRFYPGLEGIKEIYEDMLRVPNSEILCFIDFENAWSSQDSKGAEFASQFVRRRAERNITWVGILTENETGTQAMSRRPSTHRRAKTVKGLSFPAEISVYESKLSFVGTRDDIIGVVIENESIAQAVRNLFQYLWDRLPGPVIEK